MKIETSLGKLEDIARKIYKKPSEIDAHMSPLVDPNKLRVLAILESKLLSKILLLQDGQKTEIVNQIR